MRREVGHVYFVAFSSTIAPLADRNCNFYASRIWRFPVEEVIYDFRYSYLRCNASVPYFFHLLPCFVGWREAFYVR